MLFTKENRNSGYNDLCPDHKTLPVPLCALRLWMHYEVFPSGFPYLYKCSLASRTGHSSASFVEAAVSKWGAPGGSQS